MSTNNHVALKGRLGADPKLVQLEGKCFASFSIATQDRYQDMDQNFKTLDTVWHRCLVFNASLVDVAEKLKKGTLVKFNGTLSYRSFEALLADNKTIKKQEASVIAHHIEPLSSSSAASQTPS